MKALTLWQPWATLIVIGAKRLETRGWPTSYRGPLAIHAAKKMDEDSLYLCLDEPFRSVLVDAGITLIGDLPFGAVVGTASLVDCVPVEKVRDRLSEQERAFGDFRDGRFAWMLEEAQVCMEPVPAKGMQGLWEWTRKESG